MLHYMDITIMVRAVGDSAADKCHTPKKKYGYQMKICVPITAMVMCGRVEICINPITLC